VNGTPDYPPEPWRLAGQAYLSVWRPPVAARSAFSIAQQVGTSVRYSRVRSKARPTIRPSPPTVGGIDEHALPH
jgi:hypothetical protein